MGYKLCPGLRGKLEETQRKCRVVMERHRKAWPGIVCKRKGKTISVTAIFHDKLYSLIGCQ